MPRLPNNLRKNRFTNLWAMEATFGHSLDHLLAQAQGPFVTLEQNGLWLSL